MGLLGRVAVVALTTGLVLGAGTAPGLADGRHGVRSVDVVVSDARLVTGDTAELTTTASYANGRSAIVLADYRSSDGDVVQVRDGSLVAVAPGAAVITATAYRQTDRVRVVVRAAPALAYQEVWSDKYGINRIYLLRGTGFTPGTEVVVTQDSDRVTLRGDRARVAPDGSFTGTATFDPYGYGAPTTSGPSFSTGCGNPYSPPAPPFDVRFRVVDGRGVAGELLTTLRC